jgi:hypothetical protein
MWLNYLSEKMLQVLGKELKPLRPRQVNDFLEIEYFSNYLNLKSIL